MHAVARFGRQGGRRASSVPRSSGVGMAASSQPGPRFGDGEVRRGDGGAVAVAQHHGDAAEGEGFPQAQGVGAGAAGAEGKDRVREEAVVAEDVLRALIDLAQRLAGDLVAVDEVVEMPFAGVLDDPAVAAGEAGFELEAHQGTVVRHPAAAERGEDGALGDRFAGSEADAAFGSLDIDCVKRPGGDAKSGSSSVSGRGTARGR